MTRQRREWYLTVTNPPSAAAVVAAVLPDFVRWLQTCPLPADRQGAELEVAAALPPASPVADGDLGAFLPLGQVSARA